MLRYFIAGNLWLFVALLMLIGKRAWRAGPTRYSCFGVGSLTPGLYALLVVGCIAVAFACFVLMVKTCDYRRGSKALQDD